MASQVMRVKLGALSTVRCGTTSPILQCSLFPVDGGASPLPSDDDSEEPDLLTMMQLASEVGDSLFI